MKQANKEELKQISDEIAFDLGRESFTNGKDKQPNDDGLNKPYNAGWEHEKEVNAYRQLEENDS